MYTNIFQTLIDIKNIMTFYFVFWLLIETSLLSKIYLIKSIKLGYISSQNILHLNSK